MQAGGTKATAWPGSVCGTSARLPVGPGPRGPPRPAVAGGEIGHDLLGGVEGWGQGRGEGAKSAFDGVDLNSGGCGRGRAEGTEKAGGGTSIFAMALLGLCGTAGVVGYAFEGKDVHKMADKAEGQAPEPSCRSRGPTPPEGGYGGQRKAVLGALERSPARPPAPRRPVPCAPRPRPRRPSCTRTGGESAAGGPSRGQGWRSSSGTCPSSTRSWCTQASFDVRRAHHGEARPDRYVPYRLYRDATL